MDSKRVSEISSSFDPLEWAEKRKLAMAKASELREQRRTKKSNSPRIIRAESRDSVSTEGDRGEEPWKWSNQLPSQSAALSHQHVNSTRIRELTKPPVPRAAVRRAVTSPAERRVRKPQITADLGKPRIKPQAVRKASGTVPQSSRPTSRQQASCAENQQQIDNDPVTRQMVDRDTLRLENREMFVKAINFWRRSRHHKDSQTISANNNHSTSVYIRKRPLFDREAAAREYDTVTVPDAKNIITHNCLFQADLKTPYLTHLRFKFSQCFDEQSSNEDVYKSAASESVALACRGGISTICCFGQTGSGKTHTMTAIEAMASEDLFKSASSVEVEFIELGGKKVLDLLSDDKKASIKLREGPNGSLVMDGASRVSAGNPVDLASLMSAAHARRNTESTSANDVSSRSHAICILHIRPSGGKLMLVDLAGSERRKDSMWHDRDRQREGAEINASLHALKECIRWRSKGGGPAPFRLSTLTRVLAETFSNPDAKFNVIATVSPCATDVEHTVSTLTAVGLLVGSVPVETKQTEMYPKESVVRHVHPKKWTCEQVQRWLEKEGEKSANIPKSTTGAMLVRMAESRFVQVCSGDEKRGYRLFKSLRDLMHSTS